MSQPPKTVLDILTKREAALVELIGSTAPMGKIELAYAEVVYLRAKCNKVKTASKLGVDRRTLYRWFADSTIEAEVQRAFHAAKVEDVLYEGRRVRVIGPDPEDPEKVVVQAEDKSYVSVLLAEVVAPTESENS